MMWLPAAFSSAFIFGIGGFLLKVGSHKQYPTASVLLGLYTAGAIVFLSIVMTSTTMIYNGWVLVFSLMIGLGSYCGNRFLVNAYDTGPATLTSPLMSVNILLVIIMSALVYQEAISLKQYLGIGCMIVSVILLSTNNNKTAIKSKTWPIFVFLAITFIFMREGGLKIAYEHGMNNHEILLFGYLLGATIAMFSLLINKRKAPHNPLIHKSGYLLGCTIGLFSAIGMGLLAYAIARGPASVIIPIFSTRNFVAVVLMVIVFKEQLSPRQWLAVALLITGVLFIS